VGRKNSIKKFFDYNPDEPRTQIRSPSGRIHLWRGHRPMRTYCGQPVSKSWELLPVDFGSAGEDFCWSCSQRDDARGFDYYHGDDERTPWQVAKTNGREYLTPEDVKASHESRCDKNVIWRCVLQAVERKLVEDASLTAFVALELDSR